MLRKTTYARLRQSHVLGHYAANLELFTLLLRIEGSERDDTRERLRRLAFEPEQSNAQTAISWKRQIPVKDLAERSSELSRALQDEVLLDIGSACTDATGSVHTTLEQLDARAFWPASFLIYVHRDRSVVFDRDASLTEIERALADESRDYFARDFSPSAE